MFIRFWKSKFFMIGGVSALIIVLLSIFADVITPHDPTIPDFNNMFAPPQWFAYGLQGNVLGTDSLGRDMLTRLLVGSRYSLIIALVSVVLASALGVLLGLIAGYYGGWVSTLIMRAGDIQLSIPALMLAVTLFAVIGRNIYDLVIVIVVTQWPTFARIIYSSVLMTRKSEFISASIIMGSSDRRIMFTQIFPNTLTPLLVQASQSLGGFILFEAAMSFLGMGVQAPMPSWGVMIAAGRTAIQTAPWTVMVPGFALMFTVLSFNFLGDGVRDALDPKMR